MTVPYWTPESPTAASARTSMWQKAKNMTTLVTLNSESLKQLRNGLIIMIGAILLIGAGTLFAGKEYYNADVASTHARAVMTAADKCADCKKDHCTCTGCVWESGCKSTATCEGCTMNSEKTVCVDAAGCTGCEPERGCDPRHPTCEGCKILGSEFTGGAGDVCHRTCNDCTTPNGKCVPS